MSLRSQLALARKRYTRSHSSRALLSYLRLKAKAGKWDKRFVRYFNVPEPRNGHVKRFIMRGFAAGLVATATTNGKHAPGSLHYGGRAADLGLRSNEIGTARGRRKMEKFQAAEFARARRVGGYTELIGPINNKIILQGRATTLAEHTALEDAHDNHVHGGF